MDLKKIDLDKLQDYVFTADEIAIRKPAITSNSKFINIKCLDNEGIVPTVQAIPLDRVKQVKEEIDNLCEDFDGYDPDALCEYSSRVDEILNKLMAESEDK